MHPLASPANAPLGILKQHPRTHYIAGNNEVMLDDTLVMLKQLYESGNNNFSASIYDKMWHVFAAYNEGGIAKLAEEGDKDKLTEVLSKFFDGDRDKATAAIEEPCLKFAQRGFAEIIDFINGEDPHADGFEDRFAALCIEPGFPKPIDRLKWQTAAVPEQHTMPPQEQHKEPHAVPAQEHITVPAAPEVASSGGIEYRASGTDARTHLLTSRAP